MIILKRYQQRALDALERYLTLARLSDPKTAFDKVVAEEPTDRQAQRYHPRFALSGIPYVCLRLPTGGGKTLLAAHSIPLAARSFMDRGFPLVLWLVPSSIIRQQTAQALKDRRHPCREALDRAFGMGRTAIFDMDEIENIRPQDLSGKACVVVGTMQTFRVADSNKDKRKVYGDNEAFEPIFRALPNVAPGLNRKEGEDRVLYSFANILRQLRPLVIVDEAHKAATDLFGEMLERVAPCCVIEMTATPVESNILYRVYASDLKAEEMVKLPLPTTVHTDWEQAINGAVRTRLWLAEKAAQDPDDYIRPIALIQAEKKNLEHTVEAVKRHLTENEGISAAEIAVATGEQRELDGINLFDKTCPVNYVITIEALKEGWDCSFAYVFCSVANIKSTVEVEQLLGRVMRMPYAKRRRVPELNSAYAHVIAPSFAEAADSMLEHLINMGFDAEEAAAAVIPRAQLTTLPGFEDLPLFRAAGNLPGPSAPPILELELPHPPELAALSEEERGQITVTPAATGGVALVCKGPLSEEAEKAFIAAAPEQAGEIRRKAALYRARERQARPPAPSQQGRLFQVEQLKMEVGGSLEEPEPKVMLAALDWTPLQNFQGLEPGEFVYDESAHTFIFDLDGERMSYSLADRQLQFTLLTAASPFDETGLIVSLDKECVLRDVLQADMLEFCRRAVHSLLRDGAFDLGTLSRAKPALVAALKNKLESLRREALKQGLRQWLAAPASPLKISFDDPHRFPLHGYAENRAVYNGAYRFKKHHYPDVRDLKSVGEEFDCARIIDMHPQVESWVRNVDRAEGSFSLPLHDGKFYPDFVLKLKDGRCLVVEYKGEHLKDSPESLEKRLIGEFWARRSNGTCLFLMAAAKDAQGWDMERQIRATVNI